MDPTLAERILQYEISGKLVFLFEESFLYSVFGFLGNYRDAAACYERAIQEEPNELTHHEVHHLLVVLTIANSVLL